MSGHTPRSDVYSLLCYTRMCCCRCWCRHLTGIKHFNVERTPSTFYLKDVQFSTLDQLVRYYSHTDVPNKELISGVRLKFPIPRQAYLSVIEDEDYRQSASPDVYLHPVSTATFPRSTCSIFDFLLDTGLLLATHWRWTRRGKVISCVQLCLSVCLCPYCKKKTA